MTLRRLHVLVRALPKHAFVWQERDAAAARSLIATPQQIRARRAHYYGRRRAA